VQNLHGAFNFKPTGGNKLKKLLAAVLLGTAIATPALADNSSSYGGVLVGDQYIGVLFGAPIDKTLSVELSYAKVIAPTTNVTLLGTTTSNKVDTGIFGADIVGQLPWKVQTVPQLSFFAKGGLEFVSTKHTGTISGAGTTVSVNSSSSEVKLTLGAGAQYEVNKAFSARAGLGLMGSHNDLYVAAIFRF
jgi:opacity protein-like surface antigen